MSTEVEHAHSFQTGDCDCGMSFGEFLQQRNGGNHTVGMRLDPSPTPFEFPQEITRCIVIDWRTAQVKGAVIADCVALRDAETGEPILTGVEIHLRGRIGHTLVAELVTLADADGEPILDGVIDSRLSIDDDGNLATATTWWHVAEMRVGE